MSTAVEPLTYTTTVRTSEVDINNNLKLSSLFLLMQEAAARHAALYNFGIGDLMEQHLFWVLSRVKVSMATLPIAESPLDITTWPVGTDKIFALRDFVFSVPETGRIGAATTSWLIVDRRNMRPHRPDILSYLAYPTIDRPFGSDAPKIQPPPEWEFSHHQTARYNDIDMNRHVNNATYVDWMLDTLTPDQLPSAPLTFCINFNAQATWGNTLEIKKCHNEHWHFEAVRDGKPVATAQLARYDNDACLFS